MILTINVIIIITIIIKCRGRYRTPATTNMELLVTLHNGRKPLINIKKSPPPSDAVRVILMLSIKEFSFSSPCSQRKNISSIYLRHRYGLISAFRKISFSSSAINRIL